MIKALRSLLAFTALLVAVALAPTAANAQCNGVFSANSVCGSVSGGPPNQAFKVGTSGHTLPFLDGNNTFSGTNNFTGTDTFITQALGDSTTKAATTAFVQLTQAAVILTGPRTYFVRNDGSDSVCNGLSNASSASLPNCAFATWNKAVAVISVLNLNGFAVTVQAGTSATFTNGISCNSPWIGSGSVTFSGDTVTPSNVVISTTSADAIGASNYCFIHVKGFKLQTTNSGNGLHAQLSGTIQTDGLMEYGAIHDHAIAMGENGNVISAANFTLSGNSTDVIFAQNFGDFRGSPVVVTCSGALAHTSFAVVQFLGVIDATGMTFSGCGGLTGQRFFINGGWILTSTNSATFFPGSTVGSVTGNGTYDSIMGATGQYPGATDASVPLAGNVGELLSGVASSGAPVSLSNGIVSQVASVSLTPGDWDCRGTGGYTGSPTGFSFASYWIGGNPVPPDPTAGSPGYVAENNMASTLSTLALQIAPARFLLAATTTIGLYTLDTFTGGTLNGYGLVACRRMR